MSYEPRRLVAAVTACALVLVGATYAVDRTMTVNAPAAAAPAPEGAATLTIASFIYAPTPLSVKPGTTISVTNQDSAKHTVTSGTSGAVDGRFDVKLDGQGNGTFTVPTEAGSYPYICTIHPNMKATIEVTP